MSNDTRQNLPPTIELFTHDQGVKDCIVATSVAILTVNIGGKHYAALVLNRADAPLATVALLDRQEFESQSQLLGHALEDADRLDQGKAPRNCAQSLERH